MVISLACHTAGPGSVPGRICFYVHKFLFLISHRDKKVISQSSQAMQHLKLLQFQENGISELKTNASQIGHTALG